MLIRSIGKKRLMTKLKEKTVEKNVKKIWSEEEIS